MDERKKDPTKKKRFSPAQLKEKRAQLKEVQLEIEKIDEKMRSLERELTLDFLLESQEN